MSAWKAVAIGLLVGLLIGGAAFWLSQSLIYLWIGPFVGLSQALIVRKSSGSTGRLIREVALYTGVLVGGMAVAYRLFPPMP